MRVTPNEAFTRKPETGYPGKQSDSGAESHLKISVVFTTEEATLTALRTAGALASRLRARVTLIVPQVVSYQLPLNEPPVRRGWNERRLRALVSKTGVDTTVRFYLCRDKEETLARVLPPHALVVMGGKRRWWWPTSERLLAGKLRRLGHEVILKETE